MQTHPFGSEALKNHTAQVGLPPKRRSAGSFSAWGARPSLLVFLGVGALSLLSCGESSEEPCSAFECLKAPRGAYIQSDFEAQRGGAEGNFYAAPLPNENLLDSDGKPQISAFPSSVNGTENKLVKSLISIVETSARGFSTSSAVYFSLSESPFTEDAEAVELASYASSTREDSPVKLLNLREAASGRATPHPIHVEFRADGGPYGSANLLSLLPLQGRPLASGALYAAVITEGAFPKRLARSKQLEALLAGIRPPGLSDAAFKSHLDAIQILKDNQFPVDTLIGLSVFTTDDPSQSFEQAVSYALENHPAKLNAAFEAREVFPEFCVYEGRLELPVYQAGAPPYQASGGGWQFDASGNPRLDHAESARIFVTLPRRPMPEAGFPVAIFSRTGGGGDRPLVDRGVRDAEGEVLEPGTGPALELAKVGFAGVSVDGPHGGIRNITEGDEQFLIFNVGNIWALRDNVRQSALELALVSKLVESLRLDASGCAELGADAAQAGFDPALKVIMGHSMGATISPLTAAADPSLKALVLSGAGGSLIENVIHKKKPVNIKPLAEILLSLGGYSQLHPSDPALNLFQWAAEPSDSPIYAQKLNQRQAPSASPRHILMLQGIVDNYILPPIANSVSLAFGLDLAGPALDAAEPRLASFTPLSALLVHSGGVELALPAAGNIETADGQYTAVVVQHPEDGVEDGHEVFFQTALPKQQYRCFLSALAAGKTPSVGQDGCDD